jgi:multidrug efflux system membrane fusion protein
MRKYIVLLALALAAGGLYWQYAGKPAGEEKKVAKDTPPVPVKVARVAARDVPEWLEVVGRGIASESVTLKARVDGQVAAVPFEEGRHVRKGDVLLRLDPADLEARLRQAEANMARGQAQLAKARADLERYTGLRQSGFVSEEKVNDLRAALQAADAAALADKAAVDLAKLQLGYATLRAPIDGIVGAKLVFPGSAVKVNDTTLAVINRVRPLHVGFGVPEKHLPRLRAALGKGRLLARIAVNGDWAKAVEAPVTFIDNAVDAGTGTIQVKASAGNDKETLAPGQFLNVRLPLGVWADAATLPAEAVQQGPQGSYVFVVKPDMGIEQRKVVLADSRDGVAVVTQGLKDGETVVTDGHLRLTPKSKVSVKAPGKPDGKGEAKPEAKGPAAK